MERQEEDPNLLVRSRPHDYQGPTTEIISALRPISVVRSAFAIS